MAYTYPYQPTVPDPATDPANQLATYIKQPELMMVERVSDLFGIADFAADPLVPTKVTNAIKVSGKVAYNSIFDAGTSGSTKTLSIATNGPVQKVVLNNNCVFTIDTPPEGSNGKLYLIQDATGGRTFTLPTIWKWQNDTAPPFLTTPNTVTLLGFDSFNGVVLVFSAGTAYPIA